MCDAPRDAPVAAWWSAEHVLAVQAREDRSALGGPLLLLLFLGRAEAGASRRVSHDELQPVFTALVGEFGTPWTSSDVGRALRDLGSCGCWVADAIPGELWDVLLDAEFRSGLAARLLRQLWPPSRHGEIRRAVGLPDAAIEPGQRARHRLLRQNVLAAYGGACTICGLDLRLDGRPFGISMVLLRSLHDGGPLTEENALTLCPLHRLALDRGVLGLDDDRLVLVAPGLEGDMVATGLLLGYAGRPLRPPRPGFPPPAGRHLRWHRRRVFRGAVGGATAQSA